MYGSFLRLRSFAGKSPYEKMQSDVRAPSLVGCVEMLPRNAGKVSLLRYCKGWNPTSAKTGHYDLIDIYNENQRPRPCVDAADYIGPVEVKSFGEKGLGVVVTKDVHPGELLMATKAFTYVTPSKSGEQIMSFNFLTNFLDTTTQVNAVTETVYKLADQPEAEETVYNLFDGSDKRRSTYDLRKIVISNAQSPLILDVAKIERVLSYNAFGPGQVSAATSHDEPDDPDAEKPTALFRQPSLINHSCLYNSTWVRHAVGLCTTTYLSNLLTLWLYVADLLWRFSVRQSIDTVEKRRRSPHLQHR